MVNTFDVIQNYELEILDWRVRVEGWIFLKGFKNIEYLEDVEILTHASHWLIFIEIFAKDTTPPLAPYPSSKISDSV